MYLQMCWPAIAYIFREGKMCHVLLFPDNINFEHKACRLDLELIDSSRESETSENVEDALHEAGSQCSDESDILSQTFRQTKKKLCCWKGKNSYIN